VPARALARNKQKDEAYHRGPLGEQKHPLQYPLVMSGVGGSPLIVDKKKYDRNGQMKTTYLVEGVVCIMRAAGGAKMTCFTCDRGKYLTKMCDYKGHEKKMGK
jgi:hypothetical protein